MPHNIKIGYLGVGRGLPENVLTNEHVERIVDTTDEWIQQRTGIKQRRIIDPEKGESLVSLSVEAARQAIEMAGISPNQISYTRVGTNTHLKFPPVGAWVQRELGIKNASASDILSGCASYIFAVDELYNQLLLDKLVRNEDHYALAIGVDVISSLVDWSDRGTCVLFGDGAGAAVLGPVDSGEILATFTRTQGKFAELLYLKEFLKPSLRNSQTMTLETYKQTDYPTMVMEGRRVFPVAVRSMMGDIRTVIEKYNHSQDDDIKVEDVDYVIPHQANLRIIKAVQEGLGLREDQVYRDGVIYYGNTSAATIPIGYVDQWDKRPGALEVDVSFGSGFASGAILRRVRE